MDDEKIKKLFFERSEQAIAELSEKYGSLCNSVAFNILGDRLDAEECVSEAYLAVWNTVPPMDPESLRGYVCRIVRNVALKKHRANTAAKRNSTYDVALNEIEECFASPSSVEEALDASETARCVNRFLETLDKESRILFVRRYWYADTIGELSVQFGTTKHNVSVRLSRIRRKLKAHLEKEGVLF